MTAERSTAWIDAPADEVRAVLLDPLALPEWNEAFRTVSGPPAPAAGASYRVSVRGNLSGSLTYPHINTHRIVIEWAVPGFRERGEWVLRPSGRRTEVTHGFEQSGPLAALLRPVYSGVPRVRLDRLAARVPHARSI